MTSTSNKALYLAGTQFGFSIASNAAAGYTRTREILALNWGSPDAEVFRRNRPLRDGLIRRGRRQLSRTVEMKLGTFVSAAGMTLAQREAARDDEWALVQNLLYPEQGLFTIKQTRTDYAGSNISREILGELQDYQAWLWQPDDVDDGYVGLHHHPLFVMPLTFVCPFPWFADTTGTTIVNAQTLDNTLRQQTSIANGGIAQTGVRVEITASSGTATVQITNTTAPAPTAVAGAILNSITPTATPVILDWFYTNPLEWTLTQGSSDLGAKLNTGSSIGLSVGTNTLKWQTISGSLTGGVITIKTRYLWSNP